MSHSSADDRATNLSQNTAIATLIDARLSRRDFLTAAGALACIATLPLSGCATPACAVMPRFDRIDISTEDSVRVAPGYSATPFYRCGDPIGHASGSPAFKHDASNSADEQALQAGMHHDGIHYFPLPYGSSNSNHGLLVMNHEYTDDGLLHPDGYANWNAEKVRKAQNAHGCSVIEIVMRNGEWTIRGCEVTGIVMTSDARTMFINIQHPGESPSDAATPRIRLRSVRGLTDCEAHGRARRLS